MTLRASIIATILAILLAVWGAFHPRPLPPLTGQLDRIVIDKSDRTLTAWQDGKPVRTYKISLGFAPEGDKVRQGDGKTPEGIFHIDRRNNQSQFYLSLGIDYPQADDLARAREGGYSAGGDIFIHGQPKGVAHNMRVATDWTNGCVAIANSQMDELWDVTPVGTEVEITR